MKRKNRLLFTVIIVFGITYTLVNTIGETDWIKGILTSVVTVVGVSVILFQLKRDKDIAEADFILNLNNTFVQDEGIKKIYDLLRKNVNNEDSEYLNEEDRKYVVDYLTFFETVYILYKKEIFTMKELNKMFAYRFFIAVNNPEVRRLELDENGEFFDALYLLYKDWKKFRTDNGFEILNNHLDFKEYYEKTQIPKEVGSKEINGLIIRHYNLLERKNKEVWDQIDHILRECNDEFVPKLSTRGFHGKILKEGKQNTKDFAYMKELRKQQIITIEINRKIIGFVSFYHKYPDNEFKVIGKSNYIMTVCVSKEHRNQGYAKLMYQYLINDIDEYYKMDYVSTRTWETNKYHIKMLKKLGFRVDNIIKNHRENNIDTIYYFVRQNIKSGPLLGQEIE